MTVLHLPPGTVFRMSGRSYKGVFLVLAAPGQEGGDEGARYLLFNCERGMVVDPQYATILRMARTTHTLSVVLYPMGGIHD